MKSITTNSGNRTPIRIEEYITANGETRYRLVKFEDGSVVDDCQGYGIKDYDRAVNYAKVKKNCVLIAAPEYTDQHGTSDALF